MPLPRRISGRWFTVALLAVCAFAGARAGFPLPMYAARTGLQCRSCHFDPNGGGPRNQMGFTFEHQRHDLAADPDTTWSMIPSTNRIGDAIYVGTNTRMIYLYTRPQSSRAATLASFFQMEGALDVTIQPHPNLAIVMVRDFGEFSGDITRDLYGIVTDTGGHYYLRAGRIRGVFGLRQDDHTGATRGGFLNTEAGGTGGLLPYDPHGVDSGIEGGWFHGPAALSVALTNGGPAFNNKAQAVGAKLLSQVPFGQLGASIYDRYRTSVRDRATRWAVYGIFRAPGVPDLTLLGETGFGTSKDASGAETNVTGSFAEADYRLNRGVLLRARYDYEDPNRGVDGSAAERYLLESDLTLVPFADLKLSYREVVVEATNNEHQFLAMVHFYY